MLEGGSEKEASPVVPGNHGTPAAKYGVSMAVEAHDVPSLRLGAPEESSGRFRFVAGAGCMDCRHEQREGSAHVEFRWEGDDEGDPVHGRGWATLTNDGSLQRRIYQQRIRELVAAEAPRGFVSGILGEEIWL